MAQLQFQEGDSTVSFEGESIQLLPKEYALLEYLYRNKNLSISRETLLDSVWPFEAPTDRTVDDHVYRLRKKLKAWESVFVLETIRGIGYRLVEKEVPSPTNPLLQDSELADQIESLFHKYLRFGQGKALHLLTGHQQTLGVQLSPKHTQYMGFVTGDFSVYAEDNSIPFAEKAFYLLHLYHYTTFDTKKTLDYFERVYDKQLLLEDRQKEAVINLIFMYLEAGQLERASQQLQTAKEMVVSENLVGFMAFLMIFELYLLLLLETDSAIETKLRELEEFLYHNPFQREQGFYHLVKGLWLVKQGNKQAAVSSLEECLSILRQTKFVPHYLSAVRTIVLFTEKYIPAPDIHGQYKKEWEQLVKQFDFENLRIQIERQFAIHL